VVNPILYISSKKDGHCGLLHPENRKKFFEKVGLTEKQVVSMHLTHTLNVVVADKNDGGKLFEDTDGLITNVPGLFLALPVGDCAPILIYDSENNVIAAVHVGWRGLESGIIKRAVEEMNAEFESDPKNLTAYIGAYICGKHYEIKEDVSSKFSEYPEAFKWEKGKIFMDIGKVASMQLQECGVSERKIKIDFTCTFEDPGLYSYRRGDEGRNLYLFGLVKTT
jgi:YfiH family protein